MDRWTVLGLLVLLGAVTAFVLVRAPEDDRSPDQLLLVHQSELFYREGETLAKRLLPDPAAARWSHRGLDLGTDCHPVKDGIWFASGRVELGSERKAWLVFFRPADDTLLYAKVGEQTLGDSSFEQRLNGIMDK